MDNSTENTKHTIMSPLRRQNSPAKQRTPSRRVSIMSPRKSPSNARKAFQCEAVSFTPKRTKQPPRAWERRPATPFVARDEKQKIWKRVPLGELGVDTNRPSGLSRRAQDGTKDYVRVVKKLKVGHGDGDDEDKENSAVAIGSKLAQDDNYCDHLKKKRADVGYEPLETEAIESGDVPDSGMNVKMAFIGANSEKAYDQEICDEVAKPSNYERHGVIIRTQDPSHKADTESIQFQPEVVQGFSDSTQDQTQAELEAHETDPMDEVDTVAETQEVQRLPSQDNESCEHSDEELENSDDGTAHDQRSSSPPTILAENITIDELAVKQSANVDPNEQATTAPGQDSSMGQDGSRRTSDGEATFLRAFMDRAMNERMAREKAVEASFEEYKVELQQDPPEDSVDQSEDVVQEAEHQSGTNSPLRRSKRAVVTSIPRLQPVPNAIHLKRANGTEFIFTANKSTSAANIVATTRANTKKNKGSALNVSSRLEQLTAQKAGEADESQDQAKAEPTSKTSKKRKHDKTIEDAKMKKVLRWNDENLVAFREADPVIDEEQDEIEDSSQEDASTIRNGEDPNKTVKLKLTVSSNVAQKADKQTSQQSGLRRVRRGVAGTVNGTPAPKTRSRKLEEAITEDENEGVERVDAADVEASKAAPVVTTSKIPSGSRRSRMPVPTFSKKAEASTTRVKATSANNAVHDKSEQQLGRRSLRIRQ